MHTSKNTVDEPKTEGSTNKSINPEEIDLYELFLILKKRVNIIILTTLLGIVIGFLYNFFSPNLYLARTALWVDTVSDIRIDKKFLEYLKKENLTIKDLSLIFPFSTKQQRSPYLDDLSLGILNTFNFRKKISENLKDKFKDSQEILKELEILEKNLTPNNLQNFFKVEVGKNKEIIISSEQKNKKLAEEIVKIAVVEFEKEIKESSKIYSDHQSENEDFIVVKVLEEPVSFDRPVKPKRKLILAGSTLAFLFLGIFLAFVVEWWQNVKKRD